MSDRDDQQPHGRFSITDEIAAFFWETIKIVLISLAIIIPIRYYLVQPFFVKGDSMKPNLHDRDYVLVDKLGYRIHAPQRGDVIVFRYPKDPSEFFIKRIIGLPGETVEIKDNQITVYNARNPEGLRLAEDVYLPQYAERMQNMRMQVDDHDYFVMGDNRPHSSDSRIWGEVNQTLISGRAWIRLWPLDHILHIPRVTYPDTSE